jgi:hypothetical protein
MILFSFKFIAQVQKLGRIHFCLLRKAEVDCRMPRFSLFIYDNLILETEPLKQNDFVQL